MNARLGCIPRQALPCPSDADPGADDSDNATLLESVLLAQQHLRRAEAELMRGPDCEQSTVDGHIDDALAELGAEIVTTSWECP